MRTTLLCTALLSLALLRAEEPEQLRQLRGSYEAAVQKAIKPMSEAYLNELKKLRDNFTRSANLEAANAVQKEIDLYAAKVAAAAGPAPGSQSVVLDTVAVIAANSIDGYKLAPLRKGDVLTLSYVSGTWKNNGIYASDNPDVISTERGEATRLAIAEASKGGQPGKVIKAVPPETQATPFTYVVQTSRDDAVLRIFYGGNNPKAPGTVTYKVRVTR